MDELAVHGSGEGGDGLIEMHVTIQETKRANTAESHRCRKKTSRWSARQPGWSSPEKAAVASECGRGSGKRPVRAVSLSSRHHHRWEARPTGTMVLPYAWQFKQIGGLHAGVEYAGGNTGVTAAIGCHMPPSSAFRPIVLALCSHGPAIQVPDPCVTCVPLDH